MKKRLTNKIFISAFFTLIYQLLKEFNIVPEILPFYQQIVDVFCYAVMGFGIHTSFDGKDE